MGPYKDAGTGWGYNYPYSMSTDQVENIEALAKILAKVKPFCQAYIRGHGNEYQSKGEVNHRIRKKQKKGGMGQLLKTFFVFIFNSVNTQVTNKNKCGEKCQHDKTPWSSPGCLLCLSEYTLKQLYSFLGK